MVNYSIIRYQGTSTIIELSGEVNYHPYRPLKSTIPSLPDYIEGIAFLSDFPAPIIIDLGKFLGLTPKPNAEKILMELEMTSGRVAFVIPVPEIIEGEVIPHSMFPDKEQTRLPVSEYVKYDDEILLKLDPTVLTQLATQDIKKIVKPKNITASGSVMNKQTISHRRSAPTIMATVSVSKGQNVVSFMVGSSTFLIEEQYISDIFPYLGNGTAYPIDRSWIRGLINTDIGVALAVNLNDFLELPTSQTTLDLLLKVSDNSYIINADSVELLDLAELTPVFSENSENYFIKNIFYTEKGLSFLFNVEVLAKYIANNVRPDVIWKNLQELFQLDRNKIKKSLIEDTESASVNYIGLVVGDTKIFLDRDEVDEVIVFSPPTEKDGLQFTKYYDGIIPSVYLSDVIGVPRGTSRVSAIVKIDEGQLVAVHADYALNFDKLKEVFGKNFSEFLSPEISQMGSFTVVEFHEDIGVLLGSGIFLKELERVEKVSGNKFQKYNDETPSGKKEEIVVLEGVWYDNVETFLMIPGEEAYFSIDEIEKFEVKDDSNINATLKTGETIELPVGVGLISVNADLIDDNKSNKVILLEDKKIDVRILGGTS